MIGRFRGASAVFLLLCLTASAAAQPAVVRSAAGQPAAAPSTRREIQAVYSKIDAALDRKDIDTALDYDDADCQYYNRKGHLEEEGSGRQGLEDLVEIVDSIRVTTKILSFSGTSDEATVTVRNHAEARASNTVNGRALHGVSDQIVRDYWVRTDDGWRRKRCRVLQSHGIIHKNF